MEQFALIAAQDKGHRYIKNHPLLKLLPIKWAESMIPKTKARFTEIIYRKDSQDELGYIIDVPGFFIDQDKLADLDRVKIINNLINVLAKKDIRMLVFPLWRNFISVEEKYYLEENAITLLDGGLIRLVSLIAVVERLFTILKAKPHEMEVGIWGADNDIGQLWVEYLAPRLNYLAIGGYDTTMLEHLRNEILYKTGLSCEITTNPNQCLDNKSMIILSTIPEGWEGPNNSRITILSCGLFGGYGVIKDKGLASIFIESGLPSVSQNLKVANALEPWDEIGVLEANLLIMDKTYRNILANSPLTMETIKKTNEILMKYDMNLINMISNNEILSYNGFRRLYFGNCLDKAKGDIL